MQQSGTRVPHHGVCGTENCELTPRELDVLELIARGASNEAIADQLVVAPKTVRNYVSRIYGKLGVDGRAQAIVLAREVGLGQESL